MYGFRDCHTEKTLGDGEGQGGLACCSPWGHKELDTTGRLNSNNSNILRSKSHRGGISYDIPYTQSLKINDTNELIKQRLTDLENELVVARREG